MKKLEKRGFMIILACLMIPLYAWLSPAYAVNINCHTKSVQFSSPDGEDRILHEVTSAKNSWRGFVMTDRRSDSRADFSLPMNSCHSELVSESQTKEMLKQVQHDRMSGTPTGFVADNSCRPELVSGPQVGQALPDNKLTHRCHPEFISGLR